MKRSFLSALVVLGSLQAVRAVAAESDSEGANGAGAAAPVVLVADGETPAELVAAEPQGLAQEAQGQPQAAAETPKTPAAPGVKSAQLLEVPKTAAAAKRPEAPAAPAPTATGIVMNFQDADLNMVLDYLSKAAGFIVVKSGSLNGRVSATGLQPVSAEDALRLLDTMLAQHGYIAVRNDRVLRIVARENAMSEDLPVRRGSNPTEIPKSDEMVIQIIPLQYLNAEKLLENLRPLVSNPEAMTANAAGNAIIMTDSLARIHRVAAVIQALDTSISSVTTVRVFPLQYAKADDLVKVVEKIYKSSTGQASGSSNQGGFPFPFGGRGGGMGGGGSSSSNDAKPASSYSVTAASDTNTNSLVVSAPEQLMPSIAEIVKQLDIPTQEAMTLQVFPLKYADAEKVAAIIASVYSQQSSGTASSSGRGGSSQGGGFFRAFSDGGAFGGSGGGTASSGRQLQAGSVSAAADTRTNAVVVSASKSILAEISAMIEKIDATPARSERIFIHKIRHADLDRLKTTLEGLFDAPVSTTGTSSRSGTTSGASFGRSSSSNTSTSSSGTSSSNTSRSSGSSRTGSSF